MVGLLCLRADHEAQRAQIRDCHVLINKSGLAMTAFK